MQLQLFEYTFILMQNLTPKQPKKNFSIEYFREKKVI